MANVAFGSLADLLEKFSLMSASEGKADIERPTGGRKKTRRMAGLSVFLVAGARLLKKSIYTQSPSRLYQVHKQAGRGRQAVALDTKYWAASNMLV